VFYLLQIWVQPECPTKRLAYVFHQLKFVYLDDIPEGYDLTWTLFILEVASNLKELYLKVCSYLKAIPLFPSLLGPRIVWTETEVSVWVFYWGFWTGCNGLV
jgi:hypothetical protein